MPQLPVFATRTPIEPVQQQRIAPEFGQAVPQAVTRAGAAAEMMGERLMEGARQNSIVQGRITATERLGQLRTELENDPDPSNIRTRWETESRRIISEVRQGMPFFARGDFENFARLSVASEGREVGRLAARRTTEQTIATMAERAQQLARQATDPALRGAAIAEYEGMVADAVRTGAVPAHQGQALRQRFASEVDEANALNAILRNPGAAARDLADPNGPYSNLAQDARTRLAMQADNRAQAMAARAEAAAGRRDRAVMVGLSQVNGLLAAGIVPEERIAALQQQARGTGHEATVNQMVADARLTGRFSRMPAAQQATELQGLQARVTAGTANDQDLVMLQRAVGIVQAQQRDLDRDGLGRAQADGVIPQLPVLNLTDASTVNARLEAAQAATAHYGRPVSVFTEAEGRQMAQQFAGATPQQQLAMIQAMARIDDPAIAAATLRQFERVRGDGGRLPQGSLTEIARLARTDPNEALNMLSRLHSDNSDRVRRAAESTELRAALDTALRGGPLAALAGQARMTGFGPYNSRLNTQMDMVRDDAAARLAVNPNLSPTEAVQQAVSALNRGRGGVADERLAFITFPTEGGMTEGGVRTALARLREQRAAEVQIPEGVEGGQRTAAMARRDATARGVWINEGEGYALVTQNAQGQAAILGRATMEDIRRAASGAAAEQARAATVPGRQEQSARTPTPFGGAMNQPPQPLTTPRRAPPQMR